ncbi:hypothetical protein ARSEF1564_003784 [Beauveria bassiana]
MNNNKNNNSSSTRCPLHHRYHGWYHRRHTVDGGAVRASRLQAKLDRRRDAEKAVRDKKQAVEDLGRARRRR